MEGTLNTARYPFHDIYITDRARVHIGDHIYNQHFAGGLTINAKGAPLTDFTGTYAYNALAPVSTYVDRPDLRRKLEEQFHNPNPTTRQQTQTLTLVVHGIGGAGKTQLVLDYVQRHRLDYSAIFWIDTASPETIERDYIQIYNLLYNIHQEHGQDAVQLQHAVPAVKRWFYGRGKSWLFVFDNADAISDPHNPAYVDLRRFLPDDPSISVIVTSRDRSATEISQLSPVEVDKMRTEEAVILFLRQAKVYAQHEDHVQAIVHELGYLALAITLAGSYIAATPRLQADLSSYLPEYRERRKVLLAQRPTWLMHQYGDSVLTTWETTYQAVKLQSPETCQFLALLSFFHRDDIPANFPAKGINGEVPAWLSMLYPDRQLDAYDIEGFFRVLRRFSLINYQEDQASYSMHTLVQAWAYDRLDNVQHRHYGYVGALLLQVMTDGVKKANPVTRRRCVPHVVSACQKIIPCFESASVADRPILDLLSCLAQFLKQCGHSRDEVAIERFIFNRCSSWLGNGHPDTLSSMHNLAITLRDVGERQEALSMDRAVLVKRQQVLGEDHPDTLSSMSNLAITLGEVGELQEALSIQRAILAKRQEILGEDHPDALTSMHNLATTLGKVGEQQEVLPIQRAVLAKQQQVLGKDHPDTLSSMQNLASTLVEVGELQEALPMERAVLVKRQQVLGEDHPDTLSSMHNLAITLGNVGEQQEALSMERAVLVKQQQVLGEDHPDTLSSMYNLAITLGEVGEQQEALSIQRAVLVKRQQVLGEDHPDTLSSMSNMAITLGEVGELQEALPIQREVLVKRQQVLGEDHPETLKSMSNLAYTLGEVGELQEALSIQRAVLVKRQQVLGEDHPDTLSSMSNLAYTLVEIGEQQEALSIQRAVLVKRQQVLGEDHPETLESIANLARILTEVGEQQEALSMMRAVLAKFQEILGEDHLDTLGSMNNLAYALGEVGELQEALTVQRKVVRKMTTILGDEHPCTVVSRQCLQQIEAMADELTMP